MLSLRLNPLFFWIPLLGILIFGWRGNGDFLSAQSEGEFFETGIEDLLSSPDQYDGKYVVVKGFVRLDIGGDGIYPSQEVSLDFKKGIWLQIDSEDIKKYRSSYDGQYCLVEGKFSAKAKGRMGRWNGALEEISRLEPQPLPEEPWVE